MRALAPSPGSRIVALLGPTNTGKTHLALCTMREHQSGMIGLPLRLLAREVYERLRAEVGDAAVALITGEEKVVGARARYFVCTVEAMPLDREVDFLVVDEIQLAAHPTRGHVFTQRLLHARGRKETWFLGAETMRGLIQLLVPTASIERRPRLSTLRGIGQSSLSALPRRSAVIAFDEVSLFSTAERLRQRRGGVAIVMGSLPPRTRNAQVQLYETGAVDYLVATDAIGMGLNLRIRHVAFSAVAKFDGFEHRRLSAGELAQIAGRAGRHLEDGSFGSLAPLPALPDDLRFQIEESQLPPLRRLRWRTQDVDTSSVEALAHSLQQPPRRVGLRHATHGADLEALRSLQLDPECRRLAVEPAAVQTLWECCQIPRYDSLPELHWRLVKSVFKQRMQHGYLNPESLRQAVTELAAAAGPLDDLTRRLTQLRTWHYLSYQEPWWARPKPLQDLCRETEQRLSDALHNALVERFVERQRPRTRVPSKNDAPFAALQRLRDTMVARDHEATPAYTLPRTLEQTRAAATLEAPSLRVLLEGQVVAELAPGADATRPDIRITRVDLTVERSRALHGHLLTWARELLPKLLSPLSFDDRHWSAPARGLLHQLRQGLGNVRRKAVQAQIKELSPKDRERLRAGRVRLGKRFVYSLPAQQVSARRVRLALLSSAHPRTMLQPPLDLARQVLALPRRVSTTTLLAVGYERLGSHAVAIPLVEELSRRLHRRASNGETLLHPEDASRAGTDMRTLRELARALGFETTESRRNSTQRRHKPAPGHPQSPTGDIRSGQAPRRARSRRRRQLKAR